MNIKVKEITKMVWDVDFIRLLASSWMWAGFILFLIVLIVEQRDTAMARTTSRMEISTRVSMRKGCARVKGSITGRALLQSIKETMPTTRKKDMD